LKGVLKRIGGSQSDKWNNILANQTVQTLWLKHSDKETCDHQYRAAVAGLMGIGPRDELEGMVAAQLAAHNAAMECYRRAMIGEQTFEGRRENLKLGIDIAQSTVAKYMSQRRGPRSPGWQAFLRNHTAHIAGICHGIPLYAAPGYGHHPQL
jgi:hypothetical protein